MKIDLFYEIERARSAWGPNHEYQLFKDTLAEAELADRAGFDTWWQVEHHGAVELSYSSAPDVVLSAIAQRTRRLRLGHSAVLAPHRFAHPIRIAERAATLDLLSDGRLELGFARSTIPEWRLFEIDPDDTRSQMLETMQMVPRMWTTDPFNWSSDRFSIKDVSIVPKPYQRPHPPLWQACGSPDSFAMAGHCGVGALGVTLMSPLERMADLVKGYRDAIRDAEPVGSFINDQVGVFTFVHCAETVEQAIANGAAEAAAWYENSIVRFFELRERMLAREAALARSAAAHSTARTDAEEEPAGSEAGSLFYGGGTRTAVPGRDRDRLEEATLRMSGRLARGEEISGEEVWEVLNEQDSVIIGDPETVRRKIARYRDIGVDRLMCFQQVGGLTHEAIMNSIRLMGQHVIPHFSPK